MAVAKKALRQSRHLHSPTMILHRLPCRSISSPIQLRPAQASGILNGSIKKDIMALCLIYCIFDDLAYFHCITRVLLSRVPPASATLPPIVKPMTKLTKSISMPAEERAATEGRINRGQLPGSSGVYRGRPQPMRAMSRALRYIVFSKNSYQYRPGFNRLLLIWF